MKHASLKNSIADFHEGRVYIIVFRDTRLQFNNALSLFSLSIHPVDLRLFLVFLGYSMTHITNTILFPSIPNPQYKKYLNGRLSLTLITPNPPSRYVSWHYNLFLFHSQEWRTKKILATCKWFRIWKRPSRKTLMTVRRRVLLISLRLSWPIENLSRISSAICTNIAAKNFASNPDASGVHTAINTSGNCGE